MLYALHENFVLPLSHDEVVHGKGSLLGKMPGDDWQQFANLRLLFGYMWAHPGKKLLFMGGEFGQWREWKHDESLDWHVLRVPAARRACSAGSRDLNRSTAASRRCTSCDFDAAGFEWIDCNDAESSVVCVPAQGARSGRPGAGRLQLHAGAARRTTGRRAARRLLARVLEQRCAASTAAAAWATSAASTPRRCPSHGRFHSLTLTLPPLAARVASSQRGARMSMPRSSVTRVGRMPVDGPRARRHRSASRRAVDGGRFADQARASATSVDGRGRLLRRRPRSGARAAVLACAGARTTHGSECADEAARQRPLARRVHRRRARPLATTR